MIWQLEIGVWMMIASMTGFGRSQEKISWGVAIWEVRSVNHRYLEISLRLPEIFRELEQVIREILYKHVHRGKIEVFLRFQPDASFANLTINQALLDYLIESSQAVMTRLPSAEINAVDLLAWQGVMTEGQLDLKKMREPLLALFEKATEELKAGREREGQLLANAIEVRLTALSNEIIKIQSLLPRMVNKQREKIIQRMEEIKINLDPQRFEQEMVYYGQRLDVSEEIDRTLSHIIEIKRALGHSQPAGRRLDFMMQELNREANTLASKSTDSDITHAAVEMKVLIEQMREQVQNIE